MINLAEEFKASELKRIGELVNESSESFDIDAINLHLHRLERELKSTKAS